MFLNEFLIHILPKKWGYTLLITIEAQVFSHAVRAPAIYSPLSSFWRETFRTSRKETAKDDWWTEIVLLIPWAGRSWRTGIDW